MTRDKDRRRMSESSDQVLELRDLDGSTFWLLLLIMAGLMAAMIGVGMLRSNYDLLRDQQEDLIARLEKAKPGESKSEAPKA